VDIPDWPRAGGSAAGAALLKASAEDFLVEEELGFEPSGDGPHHYLFVEKTGCNTQWVASRLARHAGVRARDVGYAGLKDRHARTRQWFSVPLRDAAPTDWAGFAAEGVRLLATTRNRRKLRRGALSGNRFEVRLRDVRADRAILESGLQRVAVDGAPNYFGRQRFGREGGNLELARQLFDGERLGRREREFGLSAARAWLFNQVLARRVGDGSWDRALDGEVLILDGRGSVFHTEAADESLAARVVSGEVHPTGPLWGRDGPRPAAAAAAVEQTVAAEWQWLAAGLEAAGLEMARRSLRLVPRALAWSWEDGDCLLLRFSLPAGEYATTLVRELLETD